MTALRKVRGLLVVFALAVLFGGIVGFVSADQATAARCCWVRVCTVNPPIYCWDECRPCPPLPPWP